MLRAVPAEGDLQMKRVVPTIIIVILIAVLGTAFYRLYFVKYSYSDTEADLDEIYGVQDEDDYPVVLQDALSDYHARSFDGNIYMSFDDVRAVLNSRFYYGTADGKLYYCLPDRRIETAVGTDTWSDSAGGTSQENYRLTVLDSDTLYVALDFVKQYTNFSYEAYTEPNRVVMYTQWGDQQIATLTADTKLRVSGGVKSDIMRELDSGTQLVILDRMDHWSQVETEDGLIGYVENRRLSDAQTAAQTPVTDYAEPEYSHLSLDGKVNMVWHSVESQAGNSTLESRLARTKSVTVVAPTWLAVLDNDGSVEVRATQDYVDAVHDQGMLVWAVLDNFSKGDVQQSFLTTDASRSAVIGAAMDAVQQYGIDGINVDIESITQDYGQDYVEFIRELSIRCRAAGVYLSVDDYVPYNFNDYYRLDEQALFADYVVIMGYDEHYAGSSEPGSVASIGYVTYGIEEALNFVPASQLVNGIPFYSRIWITTSEGVSSEAYGMEDIETFITNHNMTKEWDGSVGQYYAETTENGTTYQIWVEDADSIEQKLEVMTSSGIAGVAEWCLGMETADVWEKIEAYMSDVSQ